MTADGVNDPAEVPELDQDNPPLRAALSRLCGNLAGQLSTAALDLDAAIATPWQCCALMEPLARVQRELAALRREVNKLRRADDDPPY